jgi:hypothetical protein
MKLQELIGQTELDMTVAHVKAFMLGVMSAEKPMPFKKAMEEMLSQTPEAAPLLEEELKNLWSEVEKNKPAEYQNFFPTAIDTKTFLEQAKDQLDFFLTAMSLSGTTAETCKNEDMADLIDELEDSVMEVDEYLADPADEAEGEEIQEMLLETWQEFVRVAKR